MALENYIKDKRKIIVILLCVIALIGFLLPVVHINISLLGYSTDISALNIISIFNNSDTQSGLPFGESGFAGADMFGGLAAMKCLQAWW